MAVCTSDVVRDVRRLSGIEVVNDCAGTGGAVVDCTPAAEDSDGSVATTNKVVVDVLVDGAELPLLARGAAGPTVGLPYRR